MRDSQNLFDSHSYYAIYVIYVIYVKKRPECTVYQKEADEMGKRISGDMNDLFQRQVAI